MAIRKDCPCDHDGVCPYDAQYNRDCEYWCGEEEPEDYPDEDFYDDVDETGFNPYVGCYDYDC